MGELGSPRSAVGAHAALGKPAMSVSAMIDFFKTLFAPAETPTKDPNDERTACFFVEPSWVSGAGKIGNLWGETHRYANGLPGEDADRHALYTDWRITGQDIRNAVVLIACYEMPNHLSGRCTLNGGGFKNYVRVAYEGKNGAARSVNGTHAVAEQGWCKDAPPNPELHPNWVCTCSEVDRGYNRVFDRTRSSVGE